MLILFGTKIKRKVIGQTKALWTCKHCNNKNVWPVVKDRKWFTLFFIPIIPMSATQLVICPICGSALRVYSDNREEVMPMLEMYETN